MRFETYLLLLLLFTVLWSCDNNSCDENVESWISEAPFVLNEFKQVKKEVLSNQDFVNEFSKEGSLFLNRSNEGQYLNYSLPLLQKWFESNKGYISIDKESISFCYRECQDGLNTASAYVYYNQKQFDYKSNVEIVETMELGEEWFAHVVKCQGCNE